MQGVAPQPNSITGTISGSLTHSGVAALPGDAHLPIPLIYYTGAGGTNSVYNAPAYVTGQTGPNISLTNSAVITWNNVVGQGNTAVILAESVGGRGYLGGQHNYNGPVYAYRGGTGGSVSIDHSGTVSTNKVQQVSGQTESLLLPAGLFALSKGGEGGFFDTKNNCCVGDGGAGGSVSVTTRAGSVVAMDGTTTSVAGIIALSQGGKAGSFERNLAVFAGVGGAAGTVTVDHAGRVFDQVGGAGILAASIGGAGVTAQGDETSAGSGGTVHVTLRDTAEVTIRGALTSAIGVAAISSVGTVTGKQNYSDKFMPSGAEVAVDLAQGSRIAVSGNGTFNVGVLAVSSGTAAMLQPFSSSESVAGNGAGRSGNVTVNNGGSITTSGKAAVGIAALSVGGTAFVTSVTGSGVSYLGNSGASVGQPDGAAVTVTNTGTIASSGSSAVGILAISAGGGGILSSDIQAVKTRIDSKDTWTKGVIVGSSTATGSTAQNGGAVTVANTGVITTGDSAGGGKVAMGIVAQSIGGGGGSFAGDGTAAFVGGSGGAGGNGAQVTVDNGGEVTTRNSGAIGVLAQSIGGGGGNGANAAGIFVAVGGEGGDGGSGSQVAVTNTGLVHSTGDFAAGLLAQSVGGGGGNGGFATSAGLFISTAIGGSGGKGGNGGTVEVANSGTPITNQSGAITRDGGIVTAGSHSIGLLAQSVGGGGGTGGAAHSYEAGFIYSINMAVGGAGGSGGKGGTVAVDNVGRIVTSGADAMGIVAQSIGAGGGTGAASVAKSLAVSIPDVPTFSFTSSLGGSGGVGGDGGAVVVRNASSVSASGDGSHAILAQSVGAGGGNAGDSTAATYAVAVGSPVVGVALALGATGGSAGNGGDVTVAIGSSAPGSVPAGLSDKLFGACGGCTSPTITTSGDNAAAILAQSVGGGGGNATAGDASNNNPLGSFGSGETYTFDISLGGSGGAGGSGGKVRVDIDAGAVIVTTGSNSPGIIAQSIAGGGGTSLGGSFGADVASFSGTVSLGGNGVGGGTGGEVTVNNAGSITTGRGDSIGILAQSIGGGGGVAGSNDASSTVSKVNQIEDTVNPPTGTTYSAQVAVGGKGGVAGDGGKVTVSNMGTITTAGQRAYGIEAQSIGGGGGNGGSATATATSPTADNPVAGVSIGGGGAVGGSGNAVSVTSAGQISTAGFNAHAILAQSIGGGGGVGGDGSVAADTKIKLGFGRSGSPGQSGKGGTVDVTTQSGGRIGTTGDDAMGILAQSIGGGGGTGAAGCGNSCLTSAGTLNAGYTYVPGYSIALGGGTAASGDGSKVTVTVGDNIATTGARAMGIVAQSVGGGGGFAPAATPLSTSFDTGGTGKGGDIEVTQSGNLTTSGRGAWGILAQSIGGGGGFNGDASLNLSPLKSYQAFKGVGTATADGGSIKVAVNGNIWTAGANAHGVYAQSVGAGGGLIGGAGNSATANMLSGGTGDVGKGTPQITGAAGNISITQGAGSTIRTEGPGSIAIVAQSTGTHVNSNSAISVTISGAVIGGTNLGYDLNNGVGAAGILLSGGGGFTSGVKTANAITVSSTGFVGTIDGIGGTAVTGDHGVTNLSNSGTITGSINLPFGTSTVTNNAGGVLNTGATLNASSVTNVGTINVFGAGTIGTTNLGGNFVQASTGNLVVDVNPSAQQGDLLKVTGKATLDGSVTPALTALSPLRNGSAVPILSATGGIEADSVTLPSKLLVQWKGEVTTANGNSVYSITPTVNFHPGSVQLTSNQKAVASHLAQAWRGGDGSFANKLAFLAQLDNPGQYAAVLNAYSPQATQTHSSSMVNGAGTVLGAGMSCPVFVDQSVLLGQDNCAWVKVTGQQTTQWANGGAAGYQNSGVTYRLGGQHQVAPDWYLGATFGFTQSWATMDGGSTGSGQTYDGSVALKYARGPWLLAGSVALGTATFNSNRAINVPAIGSFGPINTSLQSTQNVFLAGGRLRAAYELAFGNWYLRPYGDVDLIYTSTPGFQESGQNFALNVYGNSKATVALSPMVEFGGRINVDEKTTLHPYVAFGARFLTDNTRIVEASIAGFQGGTGTFTTTSELPGVLGAVDFGLQLYRAGGFEVRLEYGLKAGSNYFSQTGGGRIAYHF